MHTGDLIELAIQPSDLFLKATDLIDHQCDREVSRGWIDEPRGGNHAP